MSTFGEKIKHWQYLSAPGFSLIEVIIALVIMSILLFSFAMMFSRGKAFIKGQGDRRVAINLAQERLEEISSLSFGNAVNKLLTNPDTYNNDFIYTTANSVIVSNNPPRTAIENGNRMNGWGGRPNYSDYQRRTFASYVTFIDNPIPSMVDCDITTTSCSYLRVQVTVSSTKSAAEAGRVDDVSLETILSEWK